MFPCAGPTYRNSIARLGSDASVPKLRVMLRPKGPPRFVGRLESWVAGQRPTVQASSVFSGDWTHVPN